MAKKALSYEDLNEMLAEAAEGIRNDKIAVDRAQVLANIAGRRLQMVKYQIDHQRLGAAHKSIKTLEEAE